MNSNGGSSFFGSDWLGAFLIIAILFGGGLGFGGNRGPGPDVATKEFVQDSVNNQSVQSGIQNVLLAVERTNFETIKTVGDQTRDLMQQNNTNQINVIQGFNQLSSKMDMLGAQMEQCCCSIKTQMLQDKYEALEQKYRDEKEKNIGNETVQTILNALGRFVTNPPVAATTGT